jgi:starch synthase
MEFGLPGNPDIPLIGWASRLTSQKGCDLLESSLAALMGKDVQFVMLGTGEKHWAEVFSRLQGQYAGKMGVHIGFNDALVHKMMAACDLLLVPSRYEPCGLTQLYALRYGTPAVARATGGLKDTIEEYNTESRRGTGFFFRPYDAAEFLAAVDRALACYGRKDDWALLMKNCMKANFSWEKSARLYRDLYQKLAQEEKQPEAEQA